MTKLMMAVVLGLASSIALAQDAGFYAGGHIGQSNFRSSCDGIAGPGVTCDDEDTAWKVLGGYQFNRNLAAEVGYADLGEVSARGPGGTAGAEASALELVGVGMLPLGERFSLYGKAGIYRGEVDGRVDTFALTGGASETNNDITYGVGARFDLTQRVALRAEWQRYPEIGGPDTGEDDIDVLSLGALFRF